jgi:hypothetical protein
MDPILSYPLVYLPFWPMILCTSAGFLLVLWGIDRYAVYYDQRNGGSGEAGRSR